MLKKIGKIALLVLIFAGGFAAGLTVKYYIDDWRAKRNVALWMESFEAPYKNDKYGGKTPEETFDLYLAALKKGDLELASRYFWMEKQKEEWEFLKKQESNNGLNTYIVKLENIKNNWVKKQDEKYNWIDKAAYEYKTVLDKDVIDKTLGVDIKFDAGEYKSFIEFVKNSNNIWKLYN